VFVSVQLNRIIQLIICYRSVGENNVSAKIAIVVNARKGIFFSLTRVGLIIKTFHHIVKLVGIKTCFEAVILVYFIFCNEIETLMFPYRPLPETGRLGFIAAAVRRITFCIVLILIIEGKLLVGCRNISDFYIYFLKIGIGIVPSQIGLILRWLIFVRKREIIGMSLIITRLKEKLFPSTSYIHSVFVRVSACPSANCL
jgi:hypothetical protein